MKTALITGANKSIGFETARILAQKGYFVYIGSRDIGKGEEAVNQLKADGLTTLQAIQLDVTNLDSITAAQQFINDKDGKLDVLINNAGISGALPQSAESIDVAIVREVFDTNFFGVIQVTQAFLPLLRKSETAVIVNVTSGLGSLTLHSDPSWPYYNFKSAAYGTSKSALNSYTIVLAYELRDTPIRVNAVDPGYTATDFNHHQGPLKVEDSAAFVAQYALIGADGPTGKFFSHDYQSNNHESPW
ncbi:SDR family oxidoreductase [Mucilaginibacter robiniae]|uniref:SDR family oxidoreductase n=1 Tax=Mucilaginibacter robiniae TaxID=2728022 RepID=A0A7L5E0S0_9SPHI|nr:SDR family oxidoreductase [Mucilaginibacter robiniae]QJD96621.1 SDR family oxidoreductase [Mucilaginibacter robiniae]